jgi:cell fate (sporulation/competence/biofilm development) regulator YmcA (YheA/YmcA/DUF963 family)
MYKIDNNVLERKMMYEGTVVLTYKINYPSIEAKAHNFGMVNFNMYNKKQALDLQKRSENELFKQAVEHYKYNKKNGYPQRAYEVVRNYEVTLNANNVISLYADEYIYSGGAHGDTVRTSQNCKMIKLEDVFKNNPYFMVDIFKEINRQIAANSRVFFEDSCQLVISTFNPNSFYLTKDAVYIYYQHYDIAPYSTGIPTFRIKRV